MAREKVTIMAEREKIARVRELTGTQSASDAIDVALNALLRNERIRNDVAAYVAHPPTAEEIAIAHHRPNWSDLADDTDWEALYADHS